MREKEEQDSSKENYSQQQGKKREGKTSVKNLFSKRSFSFLREKEKEKEMSRETAEGNLDDFGSDDSEPRRGRLESGASLRTPSHGTHAGSMNRGVTHAKDCNVPASVAANSSRYRGFAQTGEQESLFYSESSGLGSGDDRSMDSSEQRLSLPSVRAYSSVGSSQSCSSNPSGSSLLSRRRSNGKKIGALSLPVSEDSGFEGFTKLLAHRGLTAEKIIGRSGNGSCKVMVAKDSEGSQVAIKCMCEARSEGVLHAILRREYELLRVLHHPNIVQARSFLECEDQCGLVMELCFGISLNKYMTNWSGGRYVESMMERCSVFEQAASAISYLHDRGVAHRDLHSENVLANRADKDRSAPNIKVLDFGSARRVHDASVECSDAASGMMFLDDLDRRILPPAAYSTETMLTSDVFALGLIAVGLVAQKPMLTRHVCRGDPARLLLPSSPSENFTFTPRAENYLNLLLHFNPDARITARVALETLPPGAEWFKLATTKMSL
jgi:hypothetical protein